MPCRDDTHIHKPWPTSGTHTLLIEPCETQCGWCEYETKAANNLRVHARRHLHNPSEASLNGITIVVGKAGRSRITVRSQLPLQLPHESVQDHGADDLESMVQKLRADNERLRNALLRTQAENEALRAAGGRANTAPGKDPIDPAATLPLPAHYSLPMPGPPAEKLEHISLATNTTAPATSRSCSPFLEPDYSRNSIPLHAHHDAPMQQPQPLVGTMSQIQPVPYMRAGRITKAKKAFKVHHCECGRSYSRAEHLRRHQKNHTQDGSVCHYPNCGKIFYRLDLLQRHQERHNDPGEALTSRPLPSTASGLGGTSDMAVASSTPPPALSHTAESHPALSKSKFAPKTHALDTIYPSPQSPDPHSYSNVRKRASLDFR